MAHFRSRFAISSLIFAAATLASLIGCSLVIAETLSWPWVLTTNCAGNPGNKLEFKSVTVEPNTEVCVLPPSYQYSSSLRWYVGVYIGAQYFPETTSEAEIPRCATIADSNTPVISSSTNCTTMLLTFPGLITYTPGTAPPSPGIQIETVDSPISSWRETSIALDSLGRPHIGYTRPNEVMYAYRTAGGWQKETVLASSGAVGGASLVLDPAGYPRMSFWDDADKTLKYAYKDGTGWHVEAVKVTGWERPTSLTLDSHGYPRITYYNSGLWYTYKDPGGWHHECVVCDSTAGLSSSVRLDSLDRPRIVVETTATHLFAYKDAGSWVWEWPETSGGPIGDYPSLALDSAGVPHLSYTGWGPGATLNYAYRRGAHDWHYEFVDSPGHSTGWYTSIALTPLGMPIISYYDIVEKDLKMAYLDGTGWHTQTIDSAGDVGKYTSIAVDNRGNAHISYVDDTGYKLKYAFVEAKSFDPDLDNDGINDRVDGHMTGGTSGTFVSESATYSNKFTDIHRGGTTYGEILDRSSLSITIDDIAPEGILISAAGITGTALVNVCGLTYAFYPGSSARMTCGSATTMVISGDSTIEVHLSDTLIVLLSNGSISRISQAEDEQYLIENLPESLAPVAVVVSGVTTELEPGASDTFYSEPPRITVTPASINFERVLKGRSSEQTIEVRNEGGAPLTILAIGSPGAPFSLVGGTCAAGAVLLKDGSCTIGVEFSPTVEGPAPSSEVSVTSDDPVQGIVTIHLNGRGVLFLVNPEEGTIGSRVTITGEGFGGKKGKVTMGQSALKITDWKSDTIQAVVSKVMPPEIAYDVVITRKEPKGAGPITEPEAFTMKGPEITSVEPGSGTSGSSSAIIIKGKFFGSKKGKVTLERGGLVKSCKVLSWTMDATPGVDEIQFTVPKGLAAGEDYVLRVANKVGSGTTTFAIISPLGVRSVLAYARRSISLPPRAGRILRGKLGFFEAILEVLGYKAEAFIDA